MAIGDDADTVAVTSEAMMVDVRLPPALDETFEALVFDWDGTAVPDRRADASALRRRIETLSSAGVHHFVVSGTHVGNIDGQLCARPVGRGRLFLCCNRGSEVFEVGANGPTLISRRTATADEDQALDKAAALTVEELRASGLEVRVASGRLNRRKIDLIPLPEWTDPKKANMAALLSAVSARLNASGIANLAEAVAVAASAARKAGLGDPRITSDVKHVEIGLTDKSDSARFAAAWLADRGVTGQLILIGGDEFGPIGGVPGSDSLMVVDALARAPVISVGVEPGGTPDPVMHLGGGPPQFRSLLDAQLRRRAARRVPQVDADPSWVIPLPVDKDKERVAEALGTLSNGWVGLRGSREEDGAGTAGLFTVGGAYDDEGRLLRGPLWTGLTLATAIQDDHGRRLVDLRTGTLARIDSRTGFRSLRFVSASAHHAMALRAEANVGELQAGDPLRDPGDSGFERTARDGTWVARCGLGEQEVTVTAADSSTRRAGRAIVERLATWSTSTRRGAGDDQAAQWLVQAQNAGFDALVAEHRAAWARRWADAEVVIEGGADASADQLAARFAIFHLLSAAADAGEAAVGARGLSGDAYGGHVFWDADVFVLPALAAIRPESARAMLEYRIHRLPAARAEAAARGLAGARFPWESAGDGSDVTPRMVRGPHGEPIPIATGRHEEHIVADVAWAASRYAAWTSDNAFIDQGAGRDLLVETARYWASRIRSDPNGNNHLYGVMGPDEYHEVVDDNAFTNVMARWNLRRGADLLASTGRPDDTDEGTQWRELAERLVDGWDPKRRLYEQFAGYFDLEPLLVSEFAQPPVAIDVVLGAKRVSRSQLIKQADVLMLHHLLPAEVIPGSLTPCLAFYEPRTAHGSSLSPAISASLLVRAGQPETALELFRLAARLDLDDLTGTTAGGLHLATMGGVWQALAYGFLGLQAETDALAVDPCLPEAWSALSMRLRFRGRRVGVRATHDQVTIFCDSPLLVRVAGRDMEQCRPPKVEFTLTPPEGSRA